MQTYYNVFISSTSKGLEAHRRAVIDILPPGDVHPINMEGFSATQRNALQLCYDEMRRADLFIGIYAYRYGFVPGADMTYTDADGRTHAGDGLTSITEWEYRWALARAIPLLLYVVEADRWDPAQIDADKTAIERFKKAIGSQHVYGTFSQVPESLAAKVSRDLNEQLWAWLRPSPEQAKAQEDHALIVARTRQQAEDAAPKASGRYIGTLPRSFRRDNMPFHDRVTEQARLRAAIEKRDRLITLYGRGGMGKTGLACYVIEGLEQTPGAVDGMVYRSLQTGSVTIAEIVADFARVVPLPVAPSTPPADQIAALLDNFKTAQHPDIHAITEPR